MTGRPPIPINQKRQQGDTRQRGSKKHAESLKGSVEGPRGPVVPPAWLRAEAKAHFQELTEALDEMGQLSTADRGTITAAALMFEGMKTASRGKTKSSKALCDCTQRYMQVGDRLGLNGSARARFPQRDAPTADPIEAALA